MTAVIFQNMLLKAQSVPQVNPLYISQLLVGRNGVCKESSQVGTAMFMNAFLFAEIP